ncbi:MAG: hypothetical protein OXU23_09535 [Candidatus Poribacteria bacterium]|nr:hypothetical protein [Candidatus Poribacteria bacterium]
MSKYMNIRKGTPSGIPPHTPCHVQETVGRSAGEDSHHGFRSFTVSAGTGTSKPFHSALPTLHPLM